MKRSKEDMLKTQQQVLQAAFECFKENGFDGTTIKDIADRAGVTRGAVYWHYSDKEDLYRAAVNLTMEKGDVAKYASELPTDMDMEERLVDVLWMALHENPYVDFVYQTLNFVTNREGFEDIYEKLKDAKRRLLAFFEEEVHVFLRMNGLPLDVGRNNGIGLYLLFEGMFLTKNVPIGINITIEDVKIHIHYQVADLLEMADGKREVPIRH
ncbi:TetR/AcrR family transcriptional regulator [Mobilibacterium timonense]|uniref:TetR/AcrR family transcriptional regulator n=1 Tax=Mobilibacterium timonense TaxID=1871012 RepID=UPI0009847A54|nr:TetR/AcrR family transcriptional regulator [Mobilibacterium timonense]